jgi:hypothetical protein
MPIVLRPFPERSSLPTRLTDLGRSRKAARVLIGAFGVLSVLVAGACLGVAVDASIGLPAVLRALVLLATLAGVGVIFLKGLWRPLRQPVHPLAVAHLLEAKYPKLNDSLASAIDFLTSGDNPATSPRFRKIAVVRAQRALEKYDTSRLVPTGRAWQMFWLTAMTVAVAAGLSLWKPAHAAYGVVRLADPFGEHPWPTKTLIELTAPKAKDFPLRAAIGEPFDLAFTLKGVIPDQATVAVQLENGNRYEEVVPIAAGDEDRRKVELAVLLESHRVPTSFKFQVRANDAATPWYSVTLAPPPKLVPLDGRPSPQMHATFPAYTDLPAVQLPDGAGALEAVHGTRVRLFAATDRAVVSAVLIPQGNVRDPRLASAVAPAAAMNPFAAAAIQPLADLAHSDIPVTVTDGTRLTADFIPRVSGPYQLRFTDDTGLSGTRLLEFRITPDPAPVVQLSRPAVGKDPLVLLPTASTTILTAATDRLYALKGMAVEYRVGGPEAPLRTLPLVNLDVMGTPLAAVIGGGAASVHAKQVSAEATVTLPISGFLKPDGSRPVDGDRITLRAIATDYDDVSVLKEPGRSDTEVTILVVSRPALDTILQQELAKLRPTLLELREQQRRVRERTEEVQKAAAEGKLTPEDGNKLGQAERDQRGVRNGVTDPSDGLQQAADLLLQTIRSNDVPRSTTTERVETLAADLTRLAQQNLDPVEPLVASAKQEADAAKPDTKKANDDLRKAVGRQKAAEANLDGMLKLLEQWGGAGEVKAEARALRELLGKAGDKAKDASDKVEAGKPAAELTPKEKADLDKAAEQFEQLAGRADATIQKAQRLADEKESKAAGLQAQADAKAADAKQAKADAAKQPPGSDAAAAANAKAEKLAGEAADLAAQAAKARTEAEALRNAVKDAGNQGLKEDLQNAGDKLRQNNPAESSAAQQSAGQRLDAISEALSEKAPDPQDELKKKTQTADDAFKLEQAQDELRKKVKEAAKIEDPAKREEELKKLARQQEQLQKQAEDLLEKLTSNREDEAADKLREAVEKMQGAKEELEQGKAPEELEKQALDKLEETVDKLDQQKEKEEQKLSREKQREVAEQLKALRDRLAAADAEAARIQGEVLKKKAWSLPLEKSLRDLSGTVSTVGEEVGTFTAKELEQLPVYKRLAEQAATQAAAASKRLDERLNDVKDAADGAFDPVAEAVADDRTRRPLKTAIRRLTHILDSLADDPKQQPPKPMDGGGDPMKGGGGPMGGDMPPGDQPKGIPPLAQLKALRGIQAELNTRTREFDTAHPDKTKLADADREELQELERSQREVAELFDQLKGEFEKLKSQQEPKQP